MYAVVSSTPNPTMPTREPEWTTLIVFYRLVMDVFTISIRQETPYCDETQWESIWAPKLMTWSTDTVSTLIGITLDVSQDIIYRGFECSSSNLSRTHRIKLSMIRCTLYGISMSKTPLATGLYWLLSKIVDLMKGDVREYCDLYLFIEFLCERKGYSVHDFINNEEMCLCQIKTIMGSTVNCRGLTGIDAMKRILNNSCDRTHAAVFTSLVEMREAQLEAEKADDTYWNYLKRKSPKSSNLWSIFLFIIAVAPLYVSVYHIKSVFIGIDYVIAYIFGVAVIATVIEYCLIRTTADDLSRSYCTFCGWKFRRPVLALVLVLVNGIVGMLGFRIWAGSTARTSVMKPSDTTVFHGLQSWRW